MMAVLAYQASSVDLGTMDPVYTVGTVGTVAPWAPWTLRAPGLCAPMAPMGTIEHSWTFMGTSMDTRIM